MKILIALIICLSITTSYGQAAQGLKFDCGNNITRPLQEGINVICTVSNSNTKLIASVSKGKIQSFSVIENNGKILNLKLVAKSANRKIADNPTPIVTEICRPFCILSNGILYCFDGCIPTDLIKVNQ